MNILSYLDFKIILILLNLKKLYDNVKRITEKLINLL